MKDLGASENLVGQARLADVVALLGAASTLRRVPQDPLEVHELLLRGLPTKALIYLVQNFVFLRFDESIAKAIGMSLRTYQRYVSGIAKHLNPQQSGHTWKLAEILAKAMAVFGSKEAAEQWLERPAMGLNRQKPIDLLATPAGVELVEEFLVRLEYGVYT
jgi:putative toxin-antitoxin system antitoxin component (TIGR02293 family)